MFIKQYVNLPYDCQKRHGNEVKYKALTSKGKGKKRLKWFLKPDPGNTPEKYLAKDQRAHFKDEVTEVDPNGWASNTLYLPHVGGDKYEVRICREQDDPETKSRLVEKIETWRKIFYTVHYVDEKCLNTYKKVKARMHDGFAPGFVELEEVTVSKAFVEEDVTASDPLRKMDYLYDTKTALTNKPFHVRTVFVKKACDLDHGLRTWRLKKDIDDERMKVTRGGNQYKYTATLRICDINTLVIDWFDKVKLVPDKGEKVKYKKGPKPSWLSKKGPHEIELDLSYFPALCERLENGGKVTVKVSYNSYIGEGKGCAGSCTGNRCFIGTVGFSEECNLGTFVHEVGHALQQVVKEEQLYDDAGKALTGENAADKNYTEDSNGVNQGPWHTNKQGGQGPHCAHNAKLDPIWVYDSSKGKLCTMYHKTPKDDQITNGVFCPTCVPRLKRADLSKDNMIKKNWMLY
jgi:hypothetical protein